MLTLGAEGLSNGRIVERLVIDIKTVDRHRGNIVRKSTCNRVDLGEYALRKG